ncbi:hypothetical protein L1887_57726 [Cichorium endivia]|nr:hypothetical protein L1887_57726 [Cichorium endivia]
MREQSEHAPKKRNRGELVAEFRKRMLFSALDSSTPLFCNGERAITTGDPSRGWTGADPHEVKPHLHVAIDSDRGELGSQSYMTVQVVCARPPHCPRAEEVARTLAPPSQDKRVASKLGRALCGGLSCIASQTHPKSQAAWGARTSFWMKGVRGWSRAKAILAALFRRRTTEFSEDPSGGGATREAVVHCDISDARPIASPPLSALVSRLPGLHGQSVGLQPRLSALGMAAVDVVRSEAARGETARPVDCRCGFGLGSRIGTGIGGAEFSG